jgi:HlyD family secretion protein
MQNPSRPIALSILVLMAALGSLGLSAEETPRSRNRTADKAWQAVAPGRVEPVSGEIRIGSPVGGRIDEVLVRINDKVFAGEPLIRIEDDEVRARLVVAEAQVDFRKRLRNEQSVTNRAADRRRGEDAVADGETAVVEAQAVIDRAAVARRTSGSDADLEKARAALSSAQNRLAQRKAELRRIELDAPLPTQPEGQLAVARAERAVAEKAVDKLTIRSPIAATVLQVNARPGELASPTATQPLIVIGNVSALRVRTEVDERDFAEIKIAQPVIVRAGAFPGRDFAGKVASIAPLVESANINARGLRTLTDVNVVEVMVDLAAPGPLAVGMKVDVFFRADGR